MLHEHLANAEVKYNETRRQSAEDCPTKPSMLVASLGVRYFMNPATKNPAIDDLFYDLFGQDRRTTIQGNTCMSCKGEANKFNDELSKKEYRISGLCQKGQDEVFGSDDLE